VERFVKGLLANYANMKEFRIVLRDFIVQLRQFGDTSVLYNEEVCDAFFSLDILAERPITDGLRTET